MLQKKVLHQVYLYYSIINKIVKQKFIQYFIFSTNPIVRFFTKLFFLSISYYIQHVYLCLTNLTIQITDEEIEKSSVIVIKLPYLLISNLNQPTPFAVQRIQKLISIRSLSISYQYPSRDILYPIIKPFDIDLNVLIT